MFDLSKTLFFLELAVVLFPIIEKFLENKHKEKILSWLSNVGGKAKNFFIIIVAIFQTIWVCVSVIWLIALSGFLTDLAINGSENAIKSLPNGGIIYESVNPIIFISAYIALAFAVLCYFWHKFLYAFPIFPRKISEIVTGKGKTENFPKIIDYGYYFMGAIVLFNLIIDIDPEIKIEPWLVKVEIIIALLLLSLKFTKVSLEIFKDKYNAEGVNVRTFKNITLFPIPKNPPE